MATTKISVIGAASGTFGPKVLRDVAHHKDLAGSELSLMDVNAENLEVYAKLARRVSSASGVDYRVTHTTDRKKALEGSQHVIVSFAVKRNELWQQDFEIPLKHGIQHITAECGGPGGLFHTMRNVPILLDIARDIEEVCPDALVHIVSNPEARLAMAVARHTKLKFVGLCHGVEIVMQRLAPLLDTTPDELEVTAAGINHFTWILDLRFAATGEDAYPLLREKLSDYDSRFFRLSRKLWDVFGLFPSPGDNHIGEYLPFARAFCGSDDDPNFEQAIERQRANWTEIIKQANGDASLDSFLSGRTWADTLSFPIIDSITNNRKIRMPALNLRNDGYIGNLPQDAIVEVPGTVDGGGISGVKVGDLPRAIATLCKREIGVQELAVEAAVTGDRRAALQALLVDPVVTNIQAAERVLDEVLEAQAPYLPQFRRR
jgi:alpha-galactosidase